MGCFSFMCKECGKPILSSSFRGQPVKLFLLKDGKVIEQMEGEYDSYGRVFNADCSDSILWKMDWRDVCGLMSSGHYVHPPRKEYTAEEVEKIKAMPTDEFYAYVNAESEKFRSETKFIEHLENGIAAVHVKCWKGNVPTTRSADDPNQGWGDNYELLGVIFK